MPKLILFSLFLSLSLPVLAQVNEHSGHRGSTPTPAPSTSPLPGPNSDPHESESGSAEPLSAKVMPSGHTHSNPITMQLMQRAQSLGSGTSRIPQLSPMRMWNFESNDWLWMFHGDLIAGYNQQGGPRGAQTWAGENWTMAMGSGWVGPGILDLRLMTSLEGLTLSPGGTPQLFQTGETYQGKPLIDKQHPHDLLMELAARYSWNPSDDWGLFAYAGLAGEPALGPSAFMHRPSTSDNHWAPLSHHLQDSTHISFGVGTLGLRWHDEIQLEGSLFNGREPDENRFNIDFGPLDSWSTRLSWIPNDNWVAQISYGQLKAPEPIESGNIHRTSASVTHVTLLDIGLGTGILSSSLIWGMNQEFHEDNRVLNGFGLESQYDWNQQRNHLYTRLERVDKTGLALSTTEDHGLHTVTAITFGGVRDLDSSEYFDMGLGADASLYLVDSDVQAAYGQLPYGFRVYLRLRPPTMQHMPMQ